MLIVCVGELFIGFFNIEGIKGCLEDSSGLLVPTIEAL
jgi:hypothetical protein